MGSRLKAGMGDWEFIRATQIERRECQAAHDCAWKVELGIEETRSVVVIRIVAYEVAADGAQKQFAAYETVWPNGQVQTFPACLFQAAVRLTRLVEDSRRDDALQSVKRQ